MKTKTKEAIEFLIREIDNLNKKYADSYDPVEKKKIRGEVANIRRGIRVLCLKIRELEEQNSDKYSFSGENMRFDIKHNLTSCDSLYKKKYSKYFGLDEL